MINLHILSLHLWLLALLLVVSNGKPISDLSLGFNFAMLTTQMLINLAFWRTKQWHTQYIAHDTIPVIQAVSSVSKSQGT